MANLLNLIVRNTDIAATAAASTISSTMNTISAVMDNINDSVTESKDVSNLTKQQRLNQAIYEEQLSLAQDLIRTNDRAARALGIETTNKTPTEVFKESNEKIKEILSVLNSVKV